jgi:hypothetical protein
MNFDTASLQALHGAFGSVSRCLTACPKGIVGVRRHHLSDKAPSPKPRPPTAPIALQSDLLVLPKPKVPAQLSIPRGKRALRVIKPKVERVSGAQLLSNLLSDPVLISLAYAWENASQKETPARVRSTPGVMTTNKRGISDGTYCRT